ncbi:zinc-ribbon domain-containing protein [Comamonas piscis]|uniref:Zinc-ribbon domain-containing protein n=1 Tax=Comamonas piscis TaxID=1562974 RepID=A0A7G5EPF4_9BURK|nr:zinc-ribbon and DUF3426 domain-containing protein [Comamonas piscis]QMV75879.1 zinc-ribbon domain-containing protein [Comamonas piscis]WSO33748.1 zinc-ribbon and DUF3426 domain-containing protein [Comamonas piscis]
MSQITRCPQCQTRFKVVDDQLRISDGWVRCGKCKAVFDALTHLVAGAPAATPAGPQTAAAAQALAVAPQQVPPPAIAPPSPEPVQHGAAVLRTENSLQVDPHAQVPELSVLVFPRRANASGDSGYVDSSWMQAYADEPEAPPPASAPSVPDRSGLESEWQPLADQRPESLRSSRVDCSATDDLAELQAREGRLLEALAERQKPVVQAPVPVPVEPPPPAPVEEAPPPPAQEATAPVAVDAENDNTQQGSGPPPYLRQSSAHDPIISAPVARQDDDLLLAPEMAGRTLGAGKVEPSLSAATNYVAQMDESVAAADAAVADAAAVVGMDAAAEPGFVRAAKRKAFWRKPGVVVLSLLLTVLLLAALLLQVAITQRDRLAQAQPQWRPAMQAVCRLAGCEIAPPRLLQAVSIDSTSFNAVGPRQFRLRVVLRNSADYAVAVPSLELSLNDAAEKLVLRRVLSPQDLQAPPALEPQGEWSAEMVIQVAEAAGDVVGYRVLAFYP